MFQASSQGSVLSNQRFFSHILAVVIKNILKFKPSKEKGGIRGGIQTRNQIFLGWIWIRKKTNTDHSLTRLRELPVACLLIYFFILIFNLEYGKIS